MFRNIYPILLAGGSGTRLWPLSRKSHPKQFARLISDHSLFQQSAARLSTSDQLNFNKPLTLTNADFRFIISDQLQAIGIDPGEILIEPEGKNTAPAILAACLYIMQKNPDAILLVSPSDHVIPDQQAFHQVIEGGLDAVQSGHIVTFGITPDRPETGYGYLELAQKSINEPVALKRFVEKPDAENAQKMLAAGNYLWNAGIFMFRAKDMVEAFQNYCPYLLQPVQASIDEGKKDLGFFRLAPHPWSQCQNISIDYAVMEKADNLVAVPFRAGWSDLGGWDAVWQEQSPDQNGVITYGSATAMDCSNTLLRSESSDLELVGLGLNNIIAVAMPDAVLVAHKDKAQQVKEVVSTLKEKGAPQAEKFPKDHRPWGWFESLIVTEQFQVKRIHVNPGAALSLQSHKYRSEHWVVVKGTATVTVNDDVFDLGESQSVYIPQGAIHRMENKTDHSMVLIEVQTGTYLGEDDIVRYEDIYSRD